MATRASRISLSFSSLASRAAVVGFGLVLALLVAEGVERLMEPGPDPTSISKGRYRLAKSAALGFEPIPGMANADKVADFMDYNETANSLGFRDREHPLAPPEGSYRILVLGDSIAAGHHIHRLENAFPAQLEEILNQRQQGTANKRDVEVMNFGVSGYNTQQEVEMLKERGLQYSPDLVLLAYCLNDRERSDGGILKTLLARAKVEGIGWKKSSLLAESRVYQSLVHRVRIHDVSEEHQPLFEDRVAHYFEVLAKLTSSESMTAVVAIFPDFRDTDKKVVPKEYGAIAQLAKVKGLPSWDLLSAVKKCEEQGQRGLSRDHYHPSVAGHRCIANALADEIEQTW